MCSFLGGKRSALGNKCHVAVLVYGDEDEGVDVTQRRQGAQQGCQGTCVVAREDVWGRKAFGPAERRAGRDNKPRRSGKPGGGARQRVDQPLRQLSGRLDPAPTEGPQAMTVLRRASPSRSATAPGRMAAPAPSGSPLRRQ